MNGSLFVCVAFIEYMCSDVFLHYRAYSLVAMYMLTAMHSDRTT